MRPQLLAGRDEGGQRRRGDAAQRVLRGIRVHGRPHEAQRGHALAGAPALRLGRGRHAAAREVLRRPHLVPARASARVCCGSRAALERYQARLRVESRPGHVQGSGEHGNGMPGGMRGVRFRGRAGALALGLCAARQPSLEGRPSLGAAGEAVRSDSTALLLTFQAAAVLSQCVRCPSAGRVPQRDGDSYALPQ